MSSAQILGRILLMGGVLICCFGANGTCVPSGPGPSDPTDPGSCSALPTTIDSDTTLSDSCYLSSGSVTVSNDAALTISPGTTIYFDDGDHMTVRDGSLRAVGTAGEPIVFKGRQSTAGYWGGLRFYQSNSTDNRLEYVTIQDGGGYWNANLHITGISSAPARLDVINCTLSNSSSYGLYCDESGIMGTFSSNTITGNTSGAARVDADVIGSLDADSSYTGNTVDQVRVYSSEVATAQSWPAIDAAYFFEGNLTVSNDLTIQPGAQLVFDAGKQMTVDSNGSLSASGTAALPIVLTGSQKTNGYWGGLRFYQSNSTSNQLDYVTIEYGGGYWNGCLYLNGTSSNPSRVDISNCTLRNSSKYGLYTDAHAIMAVFNSNTLTGNTNGAAYLHANVVGYLDNTSTYTGNTLDQVRILGGPVTSDQTWPAIDADYFIASSVTVSAHLTLEAGARLVFDSGDEMSVDESGALTAIGTSTSPIVLTGDEMTAGYWGGLRIHNSNSANNQLDYVTIQYGGGYWDANLYLNGSSSTPTQVSVTNCTISNSLEYGIHYIDAYVTVNSDIQTANTFSSNGSGDVYAQ
jgi:hypothetical protein